MDVIRAFLDGGELSEAALRTNGEQLFSGGRLIAGEARGKTPRHGECRGAAGPGAPDAAPGLRVMARATSQSPADAAERKGNAGAGACTRSTGARCAFAARPVKGRSMKTIVDADICTGCGECVDICPEVFEMVEAISRVKVDVRARGRGRDVPRGGGRLSGRGDHHPGLIPAEIKRGFPLSGLSRARQQQRDRHQQDEADHERQRLVPPPAARPPREDERHAHVQRRPRNSPGTAPPSPPLATIPASAPARAPPGKSAGRTSGR